MSCEICGSRCQGDRCAGCEQIARAEKRNPDSEEPTETETPVRCTECGERYQHSSEQEQCPDCGSRRRRYAGEVSA